MDARSLDIRWIRHRVSKTVHHYRNGEDLYRDQMEEYVGRTELVRDGLSSGRLDLRISGLRPSDDGQYVCTVTNGASYGEATVDVEVAATGSVPQLSLEAYEDGGIRVVCRSAGWYPQPEVLWKDPDGQRLPSVSQRHFSDERGLFDVAGIIIMTNGKGNEKWSCVVRNSRLNQEQETSLHISADFSVVGPDRPLQVTVGQDVVLPCHLSTGVDARSLDIRWIRHQFSKMVHHYQNGEDLYRDQMEEYGGRTELVRDGLSRGRLDLRISGLRPSDDGQYVCTVTDGASYGEATVDVEVAATGSVPQLSLEAYEDGGIRVVCRSAGWYPQPEVLWKDPSGQHLPSVSQRHFSDERGLFDIIIMSSL
ncbi:butyrophilin subfamily 3 member A2 [Grus japonensis]|uniref:Butyrophilin subfamily 3 member A2 n=1 Tax=Grus japonensis TaxID=30415 RepID=A0ABC9XV74_GRUJA